MTAAQTPAAAVAQPRKWPMSVASSHALGELGLIPEKTELLYGQVYEDLPKSPLHRRFVQRLLRLLRRLELPGYFLWQEQPLTLVDSEPEPDLSLIRGREEDYDDHHPATAELVIEVVVSTHDHDRSKLRAYATAGVKECWLVLAQERQVEAYRLPRAGEYGERIVMAANQRLVSAAIPGVSVELRALWDDAAK